MHENMIYISEYLIKAKTRSKQDYDAELFNQWVLFIMLNYASSPPLAGIMASMLLSMVD